MSIIATHCREIAARLHHFHGKPPADFCYTLPVDEWLALRDAISKARDSIGLPFMVAEAPVRNFMLLGVKVCQAPLEFPKRDADHGTIGK